MSALDNAQSPHPELTRCTITLDPLRTAGPELLDPKNTPGISSIKLQKIRYAHQHIFHEIVTKEADDLFASAARDTHDPGPLPPDAQPIAATFAFHPAGATAPHTVEIQPPKTIHLEHPTDAPSVLAWLFETHLAHLATILLLSSATTLTPIPDDDADEAENDRTRITLCK